MNILDDAAPTEFFAFPPYKAAKLYETGQDMTAYWD